MSPDPSAEKGSTSSISQRNFSFLVCFLTRPRSQLLNPNCCSFTPILSIPIHTQFNHPQTTGGQGGFGVFQTFPKGDFPGPKVVSGFIINRGTELLQIGGDAALSCSDFLFRGITELTEDRPYR